MKTTMPFDYYATHYINICTQSNSTKYTDPNNKTLLSYKDIVGVKLQTLQKVAQ